MSTLRPKETTRINPSLDIGNPLEPTPSDFPTTYLAIGTSGLPVAQTLSSFNGVHLTESYRQWHFGFCVERGRDCNGYCIICGGLWKQRRGRTEKRFLGCSWAGEAQIASLMVLGGCFSASSHRLTMGSQRHPLTHRWNAFSSYSICCVSDIWWCSWAEGDSNLCLLLLETSSQWIVMGPQRPAPSISKRFRHTKICLGSIFDGAPN